MTTIDNGTAHDLSSRYRQAASPCLTCYEQTHEVDNYPDDYLHTTGWWQLPLLVAPTTKLNPKYIAPGAAFRVQQATLDAYVQQPWTDARPTIVALVHNEQAGLDLTLGGAARRRGRLTALLEAVAAPTAGDKSA